MNLSRLDLAKEIYGKLREEFPSLTLKMTDRVIAQFLHSLSEKVLNENRKVQLRPYGTISRKERRTRKGYLIEYVHLKAGKNFRRVKP